MITIPSPIRVSVPLLFAIGIGAGSCFVLQSIVNARLRFALGSASWAALVSYAGGTLVMGCVLLARREAWPMTAHSAPAIDWAGGLFGAMYIVASILLLPRLGAATTVALIVSGQMLTSLAFDHMGWFGVPRQPIDLARATGALLLVVAIALIRR